MKKLLVMLIAAVMLSLVAACSDNNIATVEDDGEFVLVKGGNFVNENSNLYNQGFNLGDFYIGRYLVTQQEWVEVMSVNPSKFQGDDLPVEMVTWYDCIEYCNKRSGKEGLELYYNIEKDQKDANNLNDEDTIKWTVTVNAKANGYRLPTEVEWEYAASGGQLSKSYTFSGSDDPDEVTWYYKNSGDEYIYDCWAWPTIEGNNCKTKPVGQMKPNELGIYDMSGNVREWCWDWYDENQINPASGYVRVWRGGCWLSDAESCLIFHRGYFEPYSAGQDQGFRLCRNK